MRPCKISDPHEVKLHGLVEAGVAIVLAATWDDLVKWYGGENNLFDAHFNGTISEDDDALFLSRVNLGVYLGERISRDGMEFLRAAVRLSDNRRSP